MNGHGRHAPHAHSNAAKAAYQGGSMAESQFELLCANKGWRCGHSSISQLLSEQWHFSVKRSASEPTQLVYIRPEKRVRQSASATATSLTWLEWLGPTIDGEPRRSWLRGEATLIAFQTTRAGQRGFLVCKRVEVLDLLEHLVEESQSQVDPEAEAESTDQPRVHKLYDRAGPNGEAYGSAMMVYLRELADLPESVFYQTQRPVHKQ